MTRTGTSHFLSLRAADNYYADYGFSTGDVVRKLDDGEIHIGPPPVKPGQTLTLDTKEGRYFIEEQDK